MEQRVAEIGDALWPSLELQTALTGWVHAASPRGQFDPSLHPQQGSSADPEVHLAPALILRRRTERSLLRTFHEILTQLRGGSPVPVGVRGLVTILNRSTRDWYTQAAAFVCSSAAMFSTAAVTAGS
jgi:hypothetical protein